MNKLFSIFLILLASFSFTVTSINSPENDENNRLSPFGTSSDSCFDLEPPTITCSEDSLSIEDFEFENFEDLILGYEPTGLIDDVNCIIYEQARLSRILDSSLPVVEFLMNSKSDFDFNVDWSGNQINNPEVSNIYQMLGFLSILPGGNIETLENYLNLNCVDLTRPVLQKSTNVLRSFLSAAVERTQIDFKMINLLLDNMKPEIINRPNSLGANPLDVAIWLNNFELVQKLVQAGADMNFCSEKTGKTPFIRAVLRKQLKMVDFLLSSRKVNVNLVFKDNSNPIMIISGLLEPKFIEKMFKLCRICPNFFLKIIRESDNFYLLLKFAQEFGSENIKKSVLCLAREAVMTNNLKMIQYMHSIGVSMDFLYPSDKTPSMKLIHYAAMTGSIDTFAYLSDVVGADINEFSSNGLTPLNLAWINKRFPMVVEIIRKGSRLDFSIKMIEKIIQTNCLPLIDAILASPLEIDKLILGLGHNLITYSALNDRPDVLKMLLDSGRFNLFAPDLAGFTLFDLQSKNAVSVEISDLILDHEILFFYSNSI